MRQPEVTQRPAERREMPTPDTWCAVVQTHLPWIERLILARTGARDVVDEIVQELNLAVTQSDARPEADAEIAPWLCTIVIRLCARVLRDRTRQQRKLDGFCQTRAGETLTADPIFWLLHQEQREILRRELSAMDPQQRQLLIWKYVQGLSYPEIAKRLSTSRHAAEYRVIAARRELRERLQTRGIEGEES